MSEDKSKDVDDTVQASIASATLPVRNEPLESTKGTILKSYRSVEPKLISASEINAENDALSDMPRKVDYTVVIWNPNSDLLERYREHPF